MAKARPVEFDWRPLARHAWVGVVILFALAAYSNSFRAPFLLDNNEVILQDTRVHANTPENIDRILGRPYYQTTLTGLYRPLTTLTYLYNYAVLGDGANPDGYHRFNFWLHAANIALVYALGLALFDDRLAALALSALWGVHPVLTDAVTNIVGRADMLAAFGVLAGVLCYHYALRSAGARRAVWIAGLALATAIGMCSKESAVVVIAVIALYDVAFGRGAPSRARLAGYAAAAIPAAAFFVARANVLGRFPAGPFPFTDNPIVGAGFWAGRMTAIKVIGKYLGLLVWPARLAPEYSYSEIPVAIDGKAAAALAVCLAAAALAVWAWRRSRALSFAILFFFVTLAPVSNVFMAIGSIMGERFVYLPSVGVVAAVVFGLRQLVDRAPRFQTATVSAVGVALVLFAIRLNARNGDWLDGVRFWRSAVEATPGNHKALLSDAGGTPLIRRADRERAAAEVTRAIAILDPLPDKWSPGVAWRNAGIVYRELGDQLALHAAEPDGTEPAYWYGKSLEALARSERSERALDQTYREINSRRGTPQSTFLPSVLYLEIGRTELRLLRQKEAVGVFEFGRGLESNPDLLAELGATYEAFGEWRRAAQAYVEALEVDSSRAQLSAKLVEAYGKADPGGCAITREGGAPSLNVTCPLVHADICGAAKNVAANYQKRNQTTEADSIKRTAIVDLGCTEDLLR